MYWFRDGQVVPSLTNSFQVPSYIPQPGEKWSFQVVPITVTMVFGDPVNSPVVTVLAVPEIDAVAPSQGLIIGGDTVIVRGKYFKNLLSVKFNDVESPSVHIVSDNELEVITPFHAAGKASVTVETLGGIGRRVDAYEFVGDEDDENPEEQPGDEKERRILGCGRSDHGGSDIGANILLAACVMLALTFGAGRQKKHSN